MSSPESPEPRVPLSIIRATLISSVGAVSIASGVLMSARIDTENHRELANAERLSRCADLISEATGSEEEPLIIQPTTTRKSIKEQCGIAKYSVASTHEFSQLRSVQYDIVPSSIKVNIGTANQTRQLANAELVDSQSRDWDRVLISSGMITAWLGLLTFSSRKFYYSSSLRK